MRVAGGESVAMVDLDHAAIAALQACLDHDAAGRGVHGTAHADTEIHPGMQRGNAEKRVAANAEHARDRRAGAGLAIGSRRTFALTASRVSKAWSSARIL